MWHYTSCLLLSGRACGHALHLQADPWSFYGGGVATLIEVRWQIHGTWNRYPQCPPALSAHWLSSVAENSITEDHVHIFCRPPALQWIGVSLSFSCFVASASSGAKWCQDRFAPVGSPAPASRHLVCSHLPAACPCPALHPSTRPGSCSPWQLHDLRNLLLSK